MVGTGTLRRPMRAGLCPALGLLLLTAGCAGNRPTPPLPRPAPMGAPIATSVSASGPAAGAMSDAEVSREAARLREALSREVPEHIAPGSEESERAWIARARTAIAAAPMVIDRPQLLVVVDRDPAVQELRIILARPEASWQVIGGSKVSTGQAERRGYFITPVGVFLHTDGILDYRALGTFNENHIRGLGLKGMRVWDFGWRTAEKGWRADRDVAEIRLEMHATDPDYLEQRLGRPASQGCVRIPGTMNRFLDVHGVLDADYERAAQADGQVRSILRPEREPTPLAGNAMVVVDSSQGG
jgi:hypothetical protein